MSDMIGIRPILPGYSGNWEQGRMSALLTVEEGGPARAASGSCGILPAGGQDDDTDLEFPNELGFPKQKG